MTLYQMSFVYREDALRFRMRITVLREQCSDDLAQSDHAAGIEAHRYDEKVHAQRVEECCENRDQDACPFVLQRFVQHSSCPHFSPH